MTTDVIWVLARSTGVASLVALTLSVLTGIALRTGTFAWLSHNRGVRVVHGFLTVLWIPLGLAHVIALQGLDEGAPREKAAERRRAA